MERLLKPDEVAKVKICSSITEIDDQRQRLAYPRELALRQRIQTLLQQAEARMQTACIVCGDLAEVDRSTGHHLVLCPEHARQRRRGDMEPAWFTDEEDRNGEGAP
jgi:uncharacterized protein YlaI